MATTKDKTLGLYDTTAPVRFLHPAVKEPEPYKDPVTGKVRGEPKYGGEFLFGRDHPDYEPMWRKAMAVAAAEWGEDMVRAALDELRNEPNKEHKLIYFPFKSGDGKAAKREAKNKNGDAYKGLTVMPARSKFPPMASWLENGKVQEVESDAINDMIKSSRFYNGVDVLCTFNFVAMTVDSKRYVTTYLNKVFSTGKGQRLAGGKSAAEAFKGYIGQATAEDPTVGSLADDNIPF